MSEVVLDTSAVMPWCFEDEATDASEKLLALVEFGNAFVPALFPIEVANILEMSERRGRIDATRRVDFIALLRDLPIEVDETTPREAYGSIADLARETRLTVYDAYYIALAARLDVPIATKDRAVIEVARQRAIKLVAA